MQTTIKIVTAMQQTKKNFFILTLSYYCFVIVALRVFTLNVPREVFTLYMPFLAETSFAVIPMNETLPSSFLLMV